MSLKSPNDYRLLICDGHDSHVSAEFVSICIRERIDLLLLPPHSSHLLQPLDVGVFRPLKLAISTQVSRLVRTGVRRIQKVEWLERFIEAREHGITKENIIAGWRGAGLFPENMHRILSQLADPAQPTAPQTPPPNGTTLQPFFPNSCRPNPSSVHSINQAFLTEIANVAAVTTPYKTHIRRLCNFMEEIQAENVMLKVELQEVKEVNGHRKEREGGKHAILKNIPLASTEEVEKALRKAEAATNKKKISKKGKGKRTKKQVVLSEDEIDSSTDDSSDVEEPLSPVLFDCIEVAE